MHEHSLSNLILKKADDYRRERGAASLKSVVVRVSELSCLDPASLQLMMDHAAEEAGVAPFAVETVCDGLLGYCPHCGLSPVSEDLDCSVCGLAGCRPAADEGMLLVSCELE
jgi:Zn finger protein HypA/HybF involved in hydrogenase expression